MSFPSNILHTSDGQFFFSDIAVRFGQEVQQMLSRMGTWGSGVIGFNSKAFQPRFLHSLKWIWIMEKIAGEVYGTQMQWCWQRFNKLMKPLFFSLAIYSASVKFLESARQLMPSSGLPWSSSSLERKFTLLIQVDLKQGEHSGRNPIKSEVSGQWNSVCMEDNFPVKVRHVIDIRFFKWT